MEKAAYLVVFLMILPFISASEISFNYTQNVYAGEEFNATLSLINFTAGEYDIKIDIDNGTTRLSEIYDTGWKSTNYYVNKAINTSISNSSSFRLNITKIWQGAGNITVKTRGAEDRIFSNFLVNIAIKQQENPINQSTNQTTQNSTQENQTNQNNSQEENKYLWEIKKGEDNRTQRFYADKEVEIKLNFLKFETGNYDVKIGIIKDESIISEIYNEKDNSWDSSFYYLKDVAIFSGREKIFNLRLKKIWLNFSGTVRIEAKIKLENDTSYFTMKEGEISILEPELKNESAGDTGNEKTGGIENKTEETKISGSAVLEDGAIYLNPKDIKKGKTVYLAESENMKTIGIYGFALICLLITVLILLRRM